MKKTIEKLIKEALQSLNLESVDFVVEHPTDLKMGDYSTNVGIKTGKAKEIFSHLAVQQLSGVEKIEMAGPGFINFYLSKEFFKKSLEEIIKNGSEFGKNENLKGRKVIIEYTNTNVLKPMHIGHLIGNVVGESISRIIEVSGAEVRRNNYQGDIGLHIAKAVWGIQKQGGILDTGLHEQIEYIGRAYAEGSNAYEGDVDAQKEIKSINQFIYEDKDENIKKVYEWGKKVSLEHFEELYRILGTKFDFSFFESEVASPAIDIVREFLKKGVFEESDGAVIFKGEKYDPKLHTRVFITKQGLPTYEAKDIAHALRKYKKYPADHSIIITANEQSDYFRVVFRALAEINKDVANKTMHIAHGMLKFSTGKMASRKGNVITAEALIDEVKKKTKGDEAVAIGAIKYMILRQALGNDIIFDIEKSVSTEGDSGVYLQYAHARANSLLAKAASLAEKGQTLSTDSQGLTLKSETLRGTHEVEKLLYRFPEIVERAGKEYAPNYITTYLTELAGSFNNFYAHEQIINDSPESPYRLAITQAFNIVIKNGLTILGIPTPERM